MSTYRKFIAVIIFLSFPSFLFAGTYYVNNTTGSNATGNGSIGSPWKECPGTVSPTSPTTGWATIPVGSTILLAAGQTWTKPISITSTWFSVPTQESERTTIKSDSTTTRAIFNLTGQSATYGIYNNAHPYMSFEYLEIYGVDGAGGSNGSAGVHLGLSTGGSDYNKVRYCYIHDISSSNSLQSYGVEVNNSDYTEIAYNEIKNVEEKFIEFASSTNFGTIHHNYLHQESGTSLINDHGIVVSSHGAEIYNNIIHVDRTIRTCPGFGIKVDGGVAYGNKIYNNLIYGVDDGIGLVDTYATGDPNVVSNNTVYLKQSLFCSGSDVYGVRIQNGGNNVVENNLIYRNDDVSWNLCIRVPAVASFANNIIRNNLCSDAAYGHIDGNSQNQTTIAQFNAAYVGNGNSAANNISVSSPGLSGGTHPVASLPAGFDASWLPSAAGLSLATGSSAIDNGYAAGSPYNVDILGTSRPAGSAYDIGAYEFLSVPVLTSPLNLTISRPVTFEWEAYTGARKYQIQVDDNSDFSSPEVDVEIDCLGLCDATDTTYETDTDDLAPSTTYYWHVRALR